MTDGCNAIIEVKRAFYPLTANLEDMPSFVETTVQINGWQSTMTLPLSQYTAHGLQRECPLLRFRNRNGHHTLDDTLLANLMDGLADGTIQRGYYFEKAGANILPDGRTCFVRGTELLGPCNRPYVLAPEISNMKLSGHGSSPLQLIPLLLASPPQVLLTFAYVILVSIRSILVDNGIDLQAVLYIVGKQGFGKTTLATRIAGIYEKNGKQAGIIQAGSTHAAANTLMETLRDQPIVIDDLCLSSSRDTARKRVELASKLIRQGTGCIPIIKKSGQTTIELPCEAGLIMTAEFYLENLSDLTRCIIVPVQRPLDISCELTSDLIGDAVRHYSLWFATHCVEEIERFHIAVCSTPDNSMDVRMNTNYACLETAFQSFIHSLSEPGHISKPVLLLLKRMEDAVAEAQQYHLDMIEKIKEHFPIGNLSFCILEGYRNAAFDLTRKIEKLEKHGGILWKGDLCLRRDELIQFIRQQPGYHDWTSNQITRSLKDICALVLQEDEASTVRLTKDSPRVYRIRLNVLKDTAQKY